MDKQVQHFTTTIKFEVEFETNLGDTVYICGNVEELGNWDIKKSPKMLTDSQTYPIWETKIKLNCPQGKKIEFKYILINSEGEIIWENLPNESPRTITVENLGNYIIQSKKYSIENNIIPLHDILDYKNIDTMFDINDNSIILPRKSDKIVIVSIFLPIGIKQFKKTETGELIPEIEEYENFPITRYLNHKKMTKKLEIKWVGMLRNYFDYNEEEQLAIETYLEENDYYLIIPEDEKDINLFLYYLEKIMYPSFANSIFRPSSELFANGEKYYKSVKKINIEFVKRIKAVVDDEELIVMHDLGLFLVPDLLLVKEKNRHIGFYIHSFIPAGEAAELFPKYQEIFQSLLLCDVIGFHDYNSARNFFNIMKNFFFEININISEEGMITLSYLGRNIIIYIKHPSIDLEYYKELTQTEEFKNYDKEINEECKGKDLCVISFDYLFSLSAIYNKITAIDMFLSKNENLVNKCSFLMWIKSYQTPYFDLNSIESKLLEQEKEIEKSELSRGFTVRPEINESSLFPEKSVYYNNTIKSYKDIIDKLAKEINNKYKNDKLITLEYGLKDARKDFNIYKRLAIFKNSDIFLYPLFVDGQGIYIKEFIFMQAGKQTKYGAIVNENMAHLGFKSLVKVNPFDSDKIAESLNSINSWIFKQNRHDTNMKVLEKNKALDWQKSFISEMKRVIANDSPHKDTMSQIKDISIISLVKYNKNFKQIKTFDLIKHYKSSKRRLLLLDYENTLCKMENNEEIMFEKKSLLNISENYNPDKKEHLKSIEKKTNIHIRKLREILKSLCSDTNNMVFVISKFDHEIIENFFGDIENLGLCGEKGYYYRLPGEKKFNPLVENVDWSCRDTIEKIMGFFVEKTEGSKIIKSNSNICWSFKDSDSYFGQKQANELKEYLSIILNSPILGVFIHNNCILEVMQKNINKGSFTAKIMQEKFPEKKFDFILAIGNGDSDEEMFNYLNYTEKKLKEYNFNTKIFNVTISFRPSAAPYYFKNIDDCVDTLDSLSRIHFK